MNLKKFDRRAQYNLGMVLGLFALLWVKVVATYLQRIGMPILFGAYLAGAFMLVGCLIVYKPTKIKMMFYNWLWLSGIFLWKDYFGILTGTRI